MARKQDDGDYAASARVGNELAWLGRHSDVLPGGVVVVELRLKVSSDDAVEHMAVVKGWVDQTQVVAFVTAPELDTLAHLVVAKLQNGSMKWREETPYGTRK